MEISVIRFIILGVISGLTKGAGVLPAGPLNAAVGGTVMFTTTLTPTENLTILWNINDKRIIFSTSGGNFPAPEYKDRITLFTSTGSLELRNLALSDSGLYGVSIEPQGASQMTGNIRLEVLEPVSNVVVTVSNTDLVEFNSSVRLSCSSSGSSLSFLWLNSSSEVTASDRVQLTDGNGTSNLTIVNVTRYDQGPFSCRVSNPVSPDIDKAEPQLSISYGPENVKLIISPPQEHHVEGSNIVLSCSADSRPAALFYWFLNGDKLSDTGPDLTLMNIQMSQNGSYSCQAFNEKTLRYETSQSSAVSVLAGLVSTSSCSAGCIAGIVIACLVVCGAAAGGGGYYIYRKKKMAKTPIDRNTATITGRAGQDNTAYSGNQDVNYADIRFFQNKEGGRVQVGTQNDMSSQYAEVRMNSGRAAGSSPPTYNAYMQQSKRLAPQPTGTQVYAQVRKN